jgi:hypothetical protein
LKNLKKIDLGLRKRFMNGIHSKKKLTKFKKIQIKRKKRKIICNYSESGIENIFDLKAEIFLSEYESEKKKKPEVPEEKLPVNLSTKKRRIQEKVGDEDDERESISFQKLEEKSNVYNYKNSNYSQSSNDLIDFEKKILEKDETTIPVKLPKIQGINEKELDIFESKLLSKLKPSEIQYIQQQHNFKNSLQRTSLFEKIPIQFYNQICESFEFIQNSPKSISAEKEKRKILLKKQEKEKQILMLQEFLKSNLKKNL